MSFQLTPEQDKDLFPLCEETELGHVLRNRRMKIVRQRALELFYPKLPPFFQKNFIPFMTNLKEVLGGSLLVDDKYVGGSTEPAQQRPIDKWAKELQDRCPPIQLAPEADFQSSLFPTLQPLSEGGSAPVSEFNTIFVDIVFPYDVPVVQKKNNNTTTNSSSEKKEVENEENETKKEIAVEWNKEVPMKTIENSQTSEKSKTWSLKNESTGGLKRLARVFLPPKDKSSPKDSCAIFLNEWHPEFLSALVSAASASVERQKMMKQQQQNAASNNNNNNSNNIPSPTSMDSPTSQGYQPEVTGWLLDVVFRGYDEQNFIQIQPSFSSACESCKSTMSFSFSPITVRHCVVNKVALLSSGHILLLDAIRHKVYGRINLDCWFKENQKQQEGNNNNNNAESSSSSSSPPQQPENNPASLPSPAVGPIPFNAESSSSLMNAAASGNASFFMSQNHQVSTNSFSTEPMSSTSFGTNQTQTAGVSPTKNNKSPSSGQNNNTNNNASSSAAPSPTFEQKIQHFFEHVGISFVGNAPNEPNRFMSLGFVVVKSIVKTYEHACDADCPLSWNDVLYPELCSKAQ